MTLAKVVDWALAHKCYISYRIQTQGNHIAYKRYRGKEDRDDPLVVCTDDIYILRTSVSTKSLIVILYVT